MNDKDLSKPVCTVDIQRGRPDGNMFAVAWSSAGHALPDGPHFLYSAEYVQSLLGRIAELERQLMPQSTEESVDLLEARNRIAELERIINTPVNLPKIGGNDRYAWSDGVFNYRQDVVLALTRHGLAHGLTVQGD